MASDKPRPDSDPPAQQPQYAADNDDTYDAHSPLLSDETLAQTAVEFVKQSEKLSLQKPENEPPGQPRDMAVEARFVTPQDPVIVTTAGNRLPPVPLSEAHKLNILKDELQGGAQVVDEEAAYKTAKSAEGSSPKRSPDEPGLSFSSEKLLDIGKQERQKKAKTAKKAKKGKKLGSSPMQQSAEGSLQRAMPPSHTNPLFPPLPLYGPPSMLRNLQSATFRVSSFCLSLSFLGVIVLGSLFTNIPGAFRRIACHLTLRDPDTHRPLYAEEKRRKQLRRDMDHNWRRQRRDSSEDPAGAGVGDVTYTPTAGGPDPLVPDVAHYARRVGLDALVGRRLVEQ